MSYLTENLYFQSELYNSTGSAINAEKVDNLLAPIVNDSSNWSVAINKANVPISTIPLTVDNIGLRRYAVTLSDGTHINTTYVPQINSTKQNFLWDSEGTVIYKRTYTASGAITTISSVDYAPICGIVAIDRFIVDDFQNIYLTGPTATGSPADMLYIVGFNGTLLDTGIYSNIVDLYIDRGQKLYVADGGEDQRVFIYNNDNGLNTVSLTQAGIISQNFAGDALTGLAMVCAGDSQIIVGYDSNKLTFYNQLTFTATHDLTETAIDNLVDGVILDSENAYALLGADKPKDTILGSVSGGNVYNVQSNQQLTSGGSVEGKFAVAPIEYGSTVLQGLTRISSNQTWRTAVYDPTSEQALTSYIALPLVNNMTANKQTVVAKDELTDDLRFLNMYPPTISPSPAYWNLRARNLYITAPADVIDMDYNTISDKLFVVDSDNTVSYSDMPVCPVYIWSIPVTKDKVKISPVSYFGSNTSLKAYTGRELAISDLTSVKYDIASDYMFTLEGASGAQQINSRNPITGDVILNYPCLTAGGNILTFEFSGDLLVVPRGADQVVDYYDLVSGAVAGSLPVGSQYPLSISCAMTSSGSLTAYSDVLSIVVIQNTASVLSQVFIDSTVVSDNGNNQIYSIAANELDLVNGLPTLFVYMDIGGGPRVINQYSFGAGFSSIQLLRTIATFTTTPSIVHIDCIFNMGALIATDDTGASIIYYQGEATPYDSTKTSTYTLGAPTFYASVAQNVSLNGLIDWQTFTVDGPVIQSIAVSKYNPTVGYVVANVDRLIYQVKIDYNDKTIKYTNPLDPTPISQETYDFVSTYTTAGQTVDSKVASFEINTQTQLGSLDFPSVIITAISRNEISEQFCLIDAGVFKTYTTALALVTSGTVAGLSSASCLDVRNGEDLSAGLYSIYDMNQVVTQINAAFSECFLRLQSQGTTLTKAPLLTLDFQTGLLTLVYDASYLVPDRYIAFNDALMAIAYFANISNRIILPAPATSVTQSSRTIFNFNDLQSVQFRSNNIFVTGQFYSTNLSSSRIICEIDPDTTTFVNNIGVRLYYNPTILRSFFLNSSLPLQTISIQLFYTTKAGKEYPITLQPNDFFSTKLNFIRKF